MEATFGICIRNRVHFFIALIYSLIFFNTLNLRILIIIRHSPDHHNIVTVKQNFNFIFKFIGSNDKKIYK